MALLLCSATRCGSCAGSADGVALNEHAVDATRVGRVAQDHVDLLMMRLRASGLANMHGAAVTSLQRGRHALLRGERLAQCLPTVALLRLRHPTGACPPGAASPGRSPPASTTASPTPSTATPSPRARRSMACWPTACPSIAVGTKVTLRPPLWAPVRTC